MSDAREAVAREVPASTLTARVCQVGGEIRITSELWRTKDRPLVCQTHRGESPLPRCESCLGLISVDLVEAAWFSGAPVLCSVCDTLPAKERESFLEDLGRRRLLELGIPARREIRGATA